MKANEILRKTVEECVIKNRPNFDGIGIFGATIIDEGKGYVTVRFDLGMYFDPDQVVEMVDTFESISDIFAEAIEHQDENAGYFTMRFDENVAAEWVSNYG